MMNEEKRLAENHDGGGVAAGMTTFARRLGKAVLGIGVLAVCLALISCDRRPAADSSSVARERAPRTLARFCARPLGRAEAPLKIEAVLPVSSGCQDGVGLYLVGLAESRPDLFRVAVYDMKSDSGHEVMLHNRIRCAAIVINGETRFDLGEEGGKILLEGPMDPLDVYHVLVFLLRQLAPPSPFVPPEPAIGNAPSADQRRKAGF